jgi:peptidoglycan LD-endopeptidase LytH
VKVLGIVALGLTIAALAATVRCVPNAKVPATTDPDVVSGLMVPVRGVERDQLRDNWHDSRDGGARAHEGLDIPAPRGTPVLAAMEGRLEKLFQSKAGGLTLYIRSKGFSAYYAHLAGYAPGLAEGQNIRAGQVIGFVGDTGNAGAGNTHLHFGLAKMNPGERWWEGQPINPYPLLAVKDAAR